MFIITAAGKGANPQEEADGLPEMQVLNAESSERTQGNVYPWVSCTFTYG